MATGNVVFGFDLGIGSVGWCVIDRATGRIVAMGSHVFAAPQNNKTHESLAGERRASRGQRRNINRREGRRRAALLALERYGIVPCGTQGKDLQTRKGDADPRDLRVEGLRRRLDDREFARVLFNIAKHRGYVSHARGAGTSKEDGKILSAISSNGERLVQTGCETMTEMMRATGEGRCRNKGGDYSNTMSFVDVLDEVRLIFSRQREFGNQKASEEFEGDFVRVLEFEQPSLKRDDRSYAQVGCCSYFPNEKRASKADLSVEMCCAYERLGNILIVDSDASAMHVPPDVRDQVIDLLFSPSVEKGADAITYKRLRKLVGMTPEQGFKGVKDDDERGVACSAKAWPSLRKTLGTRLVSRLRDDVQLADAVCEALTYASSDESLARQLEAIGGLSKDDIDELVANAPFCSTLFNGYGSRGLSSVRMLLDAFDSDEVVTLTDAERSTGLLQLRMARPSAVERSKRLPPYLSYDSTCTNPVVLRCMGQFRKVFNRLVNRYGAPDGVSLELARELRLSKRKRDEIDKERKKHEGENRRLAKRAAEILGCPVTEVRGGAVSRLRLFEEQCGMDPYTGEALDVTKVVADEIYAEIDHILPYSRTSNDQANNKVLVRKASNQNKGNRTPYEWMTSGEKSAPSWDAFFARVTSDKTFARRRANLLDTSLDRAAEDGFISRNLNDTSYASKAACAYVEDCFIWPDMSRRQHVQTIKGQMTAVLRRAWGLDDNGRKDRGDIRHHAVDAAIIAVASPALVRHVAVASACGQRAFQRARQEELPDMLPWPTFTRDVLAAREVAVTSHMRRHRGNGRMVGETTYRLLGIEDGYATYVKSNGDVGKAGNYVLKDGGKAIQLVDKMSHLVLWLDRNGRNGRGKWYIEPVYYADKADIAAGTCPHRLLNRAHVARAIWTPKAEIDSNPRGDVHEPSWGKPIVVYRDDVLSVDGVEGRFRSLDISSGAMLATNGLTNQREGAPWPSVRKWGNETVVKVL